MQTLFSRIVERKTKISVVGLGYVGMPLAVAFSQKADVIGFDSNIKKIELYRRGIDPTKEIGNAGIKSCEVDFTNIEERLQEAMFHIVAVPTPIREDKTPDLFAVETASQVVGRNLARGSVVVYESTVYPGVTEDICVPILESASGLKCGLDFKVGYSPERINPGDQQHRLESITKIVSGMDEETLEIVAKVYELVVNVGVYRVDSIRIAEAAKIIENCQRDINIAFMNELAIIFNKMGIDTKSVLEAARTKWNFIGFSPGLVGGHCIGVDPYYLTYKAEQMGYHSQIILSGRRINDDMGKYIVENTIKSLIKTGKSIQECKIAILGLTFKENCPDVRNTKVLDIVREMNEYEIIPFIADPVADYQEQAYEKRFRFVDLGDIKDMDALIIAVAHREFKLLTMDDIDKMLKCGENRNKVIIDIKSILNRRQVETMGYRYWSL